MDGITVAALCAEFNDALSGGVISKIIQPEPYAVQLAVKKNKDLKRLRLCAAASLPLAYLTDKNETAPLEAPPFTMLLRKHFQGGQILRFVQPGLERVICVEVMHRNELGDLEKVFLVLELMGKHSNLIAVDETETVLDAIRRVPPQMSSVRTVLPGRPYFLPAQEGRRDLYREMTEGYDPADFLMPLLSSSEESCVNVLAGSVTGLSRPFCEDLCAAAGSDPRRASKDEPEEIRRAVIRNLTDCFTRVFDCAFSPSIRYDGRKPAAFSALPSLSGTSGQTSSHGSVSEVVRLFYEEKSRADRMKQKASTMRHLAKTAAARAARKYDLQRRQLQDTDKMETSRLYGELLLSCAHSVPEKASFIDAENYYDGTAVRIPLDPSLSAHENANRYFARYAKMKRTRASVTEQLQETKKEIETLEGILDALDLSEDDADLSQVREEMVRAGLMKKTSGSKQEKIRKERSAPLRFRSSDGFDMFVGKNNLQNDYVSFSLAGPDDWWFHANDVPGSHVVVLTKGKEVPDRTFEEAGALAAHFSRAGASDRVEVDYLLRKHLKKPGGAPPGFVIYHTNYSLIASTDISGIERV